MSGNGDLTPRSEQRPGKPIFRDLSEIAERRK